MYFVSVPAAACDDQTGSHPDNASQNTAKADLRLVAPAETPVSDPDPSIEGDPSALAARILQLHATSETEERANCRPPKLVGDHEDPAIEMPGILKRSDPLHKSAGLDPMPVPQPRVARRRAADTRSGPSFKTLLACAILAVSVTGPAVYLFVPGAPESVATDRQVETELIATKPTIESLIDADRTARQTDSAVRPDAPSQAQIAEAKNRIRSAFAASGITAPEAATLAKPLGTSAGAQIGKRQERLATAGPDQQSPHPPALPADLPRIASSSATSIVVPTQAVTAQPAAPIALPPEPAGNDAPLPSSSSVTADTVTGGDTAYPHTGTILASVNLRESEDKDGTILTTVPAGTEVRYGNCGTWWCAVAYDGQTGFVGQKFLERSP